MKSKKKNLLPRRSNRKGNKKKQRKKSKKRRKVKRSESAILRRLAKMSSLSRLMGY